MQPTVGRIVHCWPEKHDVPGGQTLTCAAIVTGVKADAIAVHYFLPDGANGACELPLEEQPEAAGTRGHWWWPPRA